MGRSPIKTSPSPTFSLLMTILETEPMELSNTVATSPSQLIIEAGRTERQYWRDLWRYRELFYVLAWRDISVRYKQTAIGVLWAILQPLLTTIVLTVTFSRIAHMPSLSGAPYALIVFSGNLAWQFFSMSLA